MYQPRLWTLEEKSILRTYYGHISIKELQLKLFEFKKDYLRTFGSIRTKAKELNLTITKYDTQNRFSQLEVDYILNNLNKLSRKQIALNLGRHPRSISKYLMTNYPHLSKFKPIKWTKYHDKLLLANKNKSKVFLMSLLKCSETTLIKHMRLLGLKEEATFKHYSDDEIKFILSNYKTISRKMIALKLNRTENGITGFLVNRGLIDNHRNIVPWTKEDIEYCKSNFNKKTSTQIANDLGRTLNSVSYKLRSLGLIRKNTKWTEEETQFIKDNQHLQYSEIAILLNRHPDSIRKKSKDLGLYKHHKLIKWTEKEIKFVKDNYKKYNTQLLASKLNKSYSNVYKKKKELNLE